MFLMLNKLKSFMLFGAMPQIALVFILSSCVVYQLNDGKKYINTFPVKDEYIVSDSELSKHTFQLKEYLSDDTTNSDYYFINTKDIFKIVDTIKNDLFIIFYYPNCEASLKTIKLAENLDNKKINYILIAESYNPSRSLNMLNLFHLRNKTAYILPTMNSENTIILQKKINFIKALNPDLYAIYKDELIFNSIIHISKEKKYVLNPIYGKGFAANDSLVKWVNNFIDNKN